MCVEEQGEVGRGGGWKEGGTEGGGVVSLSSILLVFRFWSVDFFFLFFVFLWFLTARPEVHHDRLDLLQADR